MGKYLKTPMDHKIIDYLAIEVYKNNPKNPVLVKFMNMKNEEGYHISKTIKEYEKTNEHPDHNITDGTWRSATGKITFTQFLNGIEEEDLSKIPVS